MTDIEALETDMRGVCYRDGKPTIADYNEAITDLIAAKHQLQSGSLMGCGICGDSGHAPQDGCHHDPLILARQWASATSVWQCYHCGFIATNDAEAREHFGLNEYSPAACQTARPAPDQDAEEPPVPCPVHPGEVDCCLLFDDGWAQVGYYREQLAQRGFEADRARSAAIEFAQKYKAATLREAEAVLAERERCARVAETANILGLTSNRARRDIATAIRAGISGEGE